MCVKSVRLYKKDKWGKIIREITWIIIDNVDNCVLIIDEAQNILNNNDYRKAVYEQTVLLNGHFY